MNRASLDRAIVSREADQLVLEWKAAAGDRVEQEQQENDAG